MEVTVSRVSPVEVELKVSLPKEQVRTALARAYSELGKHAQIRGFRKGKVPLPLLKQYFGDRVAAEVSGQLVDQSLPQAIDQQKLEPVVQPQVVPDVALVEGADWSYKAKLEVRPEIGDIGLEGITVQREVHTIDDADVAHQIEHLREAHSTLRTPEPARPVQGGDIVTLGYDVTIDGEARADLAAHDRSVEVGKGRLLKELDEGIVGMSVGETKEIPVHFADDHAREDLRGKDAVLKVTVTEIREKLLPELDDEFAKDAGSDTLEALKAKVRADMEKQRQEASEQKLREDAVNALVEKHPVAVPPSLAQNALGVIAREMVQMMRFQGGQIDAEQILETAKNQAESRVRAGLLLAELARRHNVTISEDDLNARIDEMAKETGKAAAKLRAEHRDPKKREALANAVLEDKVLALLLSKVTIQDVPAPKQPHDHDHQH
jgi:trigger factor